MSSLTKEQRTRIENNLRKAVLSSDDSKLRECLQSAHGLPLDFPCRGVPSKDLEGCTLLCTAASMGNSAAVNFLIQGGADVTSTSKSGLTPLHLAIEKGDPLSVHVLATREGTLELVDSNGCTPLIRAAALNHKEIIDILVECGANKEAADESGMTALLKAAEAGATEAYIGLHKLGANTECKDFCGYTTLQLAMRNGHANITRYILEGVEEKPDNYWEQEAARKKELQELHDEQLKDLLASHRSS